MSLPPGFLDELRTRLSLTQVVGRKVLWDTRKSNQAKGDMWAPCPFHQEKTASFHVDDRKGFYYCFGCHAKGDAISFVKDTENVGFMEAVEILAREAGLAMPARDPRAQAKADRRTVLAGVMEQAVKHYRLQLQTAQAGEARAYLERRGLDATALERFEIGFAPDCRRGVLEALTAKSVAEADIVEAGLAARPDDGGPAYDRFRGRIMFPIRDARGRAIAFGGRAMDPNARAKYLNSPETPLFDKGRCLYNHGPAREAAGKGAPLVVAEGYMDVIALVQAGFTAAVAPLGTAITADQLGLLWRIAPEPVIALDGDKAGLRAGLRLIDLALPLLTAGQSLRFAMLPAGQDPDDLIKAQGAAAMQAAIDTARPLLELLWERETAGQSFDSPERRAALDKRLRAVVSTIADPGLRHHYGQAIRDLRWQLFRSPRAETQQGRRARHGRPRQGGPVGSARPETRATPLASDPANREAERIRELCILGICLLRPDTIATFDADLEQLEMIGDRHERLLRAILRCAASEPADGLVPAVAQIAGTEAVDMVLGSPHLRVAPWFKDRGADHIVVASLAESLAKLRAERGLRLELEDAFAELTPQRQDRSPGDAASVDPLRYRLSEATQEHQRAQRGYAEDQSTYDTAENGVTLDRDERASFRALLATLKLGTSGKPE